MSLEQAEIGFIGLGAMGGGIARRLNLASRPAYQDLQSD